MQSVWYSIKVIAVQKRPEALGLIAICSDDVQCAPMSKGMKLKPTKRL